MNYEIINGKRVMAYDNGGKTADRYTVALLDGYNSGNFIECLCMSEFPFHPMGIGEHSTCMLGRHLGARMAVGDLPDDCIKLVMRDLS